MADAELSSLGSVIKTAYEGQANTNAFTDADEAKLDGIVEGIADGDHLVVNDADAAATDYARLTATGIEGRGPAEVRSDLDLEIGTDVLAQQTIGIADDNLLEVDDLDAADNDYAKFTAAGLEGRSFAEVRSDLNLEIGIDVLAQKTIGIADNNLLEVDDLDAAATDFARFTATGLQGRSPTEARSDLGLGDAAVAGVKNSIEIDTGDIQLIGDEASPGVDQVYGTDGAGTKGWKADPAGGSGEVGISGIPATNEYARWVDATDIEGRSAAEVALDIDAVTVSGDELLDPDGSNAFTQNPKFWSGTQAQFDAIATPDNDTIYLVITE